MSEVGIGKISRTDTGRGESSLSRRKHRPGLQRVSIACERCRTRKNKCDRKLPECSTCKAAGAVCVIQDRLTNRQYPRGHVEGLEAEVNRLRLRVQELESQLQHRSNVVQSPEGLVGFTQDAEAANNTADTSHITDSTVGSSTSPFSTLANDLQVVPRGVTSKYLGDSGGLFFGNIVQAILLQADYKGEQGPSPSTLRLRITGKDPDHSTTNFKFPDAILARRLENAYFTSWWPALPYVHRPSFLRDHFEPCTTLQTEASPVSLFMTLMILALGAIDVKRKDPEFGNKHIEYFRYATENYLHAILKEDNVETVQGLLLLAQFSVNEQQSINAWLVAGQAVRTAIDLGLHRKQASTTHSVDRMKTEIRVRIFWSAYALDRNVSITLGRPCAIRDEDIDVPFPQNVTDDDLSAGILQVGQPLPIGNQPLDMSTFIHIVKLRQIQSRIQALFYSADTSRLQDLGVHYHQTSIRAQLDEWIALSPRYFHPTVATFQSMEWFQIAYSHALLLLHRPSPACPVISSEALQLCADSAISLISSYSSLYAKNKITYTWIALHSLFMASITMLYTLSVDPDIRASTTQVVVKSNIDSCLALFQVMYEYWPLAARCHDIVGRIGTYVVSLFGRGDDATIHHGSGAHGEARSEQHFGKIDAEFMEWFGTRQNHSEFMVATAAHDCHDGISGAEFDNNINSSSSNMDFDLSHFDALFPQEFDMSIPMMMSAFGNEGQSQSHTPRPADTSDPPLPPK